MAPGFRVFQTKPGPGTEITTQLQDGQPWEDATGEAELTRDGDSLNVTFYKSGLILSGQIMSIGLGYYMDYTMQVPNSFSGRTRGLLGNMDGNPANDFYRKGETTPLPDAISERDLFSDLLTCKEFSVYYIHLK